MRTKFQRPWMLYVALLTSAAMSGANSAAAATFNVVNGDYHVSTNWTGSAVVPGDGNNEQAIIGAAAGRTANYNVATNYTTTARLLIANGSGFTGTLNMSGAAGTLTFGGDLFSNANYIGVGNGTGVLNVTGGNLNFSNGGVGGHLFIGANNASSVGTLTLDNSSSTINVATRVLLGQNASGAQGTLTINSGTMNVGTGSNGDADKGAIYLAGSNNVSGGKGIVNLNGGTLSLVRFIPNHPTNSASQKELNLNGGTLQARADRSDFLYSAIGFVTNVQAGGAIVDTNGFNVTISAPLFHDAALGATPDGGLTKKGAGTLTLSTTTSTFTGDIEVQQGTLAVAGQLNNPAPPTTVLGNPNIAGRTLTVRNNAVLSFGGTDTLGNSSANPSLSLIADGGTITNSGAYFNTLGAVTLNAGTLSAVGGANASFRSYFLKGTVTVGGAAASTIASSGTNSGIHLSSATVFNVANATGDAAPDLIVTAVLLNEAPLNAVAGGLVKNGAGTMVLQNTNAFSGGATVNAGTLELGHATDTLLNTGTVTINGGTLALGANNDTVGQVVLAGGSITGSTGVLTSGAGGFDVRSGSASAILGGALGLTKTTGGTVTLSGANTYTGATNVNAGTLRYDGTHAGAGAFSVGSGGTLLFNGTKSGSGTLTVASGGTLGGSGFIAGNTTIQTGGTLSPGNSPGTLTFTDNLTVSGTYNWELGDLTVVEDLLTLNSTWVLNIVGSSRLLARNDAEGLLTAVKLFEYDTVSFNLPGSVLGFGGYLTSDVWNDGQGAVWLNAWVVPVPEPSTFVLLALATAFLGGAAYRRGKSARTAASQP